MIGARVNHGFDRSRSTRGAGVGQIIFHLCHRQIVVLSRQAAATPERRVSAALGNRTKASSGIEADVPGKSV
jgi:hypothetical protein